MKYPIYMMTYERPDYFEKSLKSLLKTNLSQGELTIFDSCSQDIKKKELLKTCKQNVIYLTKRLQTQAMFAKMVEHFLQYDYTNCFIVIQDDIVYNSQWLNKLLEIKDMIPNLGILSPWDRLDGKYSNGKSWVMRNPQIDKNGKYTSGFMGGVCWLVTRVFAIYFHKWALQEIPKGKVRGTGYDTAFQKLCYSFGFNIAATCPSYVEHFGVVSVARKGKMRGGIGGYCAENFVGEN